MGAGGDAVEVGIIQHEDGDGVSETSPLKDNFGSCRGKM
jgi:hypothetical protein